MFKCICGKEFLSSRSLARHKQWCKLVIGESKYNEKVNKISGSGNSFYGKHHTEETKSHLSQVHTGKVLSDITKLRISTSNIGKHTISYENRLKINESIKGRVSNMKGKTHSDESKRKISESLKGRVIPESTKKKLSKRMTGSNNPMYGIPPSVNSKFGNFSYYSNYTFRSSYEAIFAIWLLYNKINFEYESVKLKYIDENRTYTPDFYLPDDNLLIEIKGYYNSKLLLSEMLVLANGYNFQSIVGGQIWKYYNELIDASVNIDELYDALKIKKGLKWNFINNKIIIDKE